MFHLATLSTCGELQASSATLPSLRPRAQIRSIARHWHQHFAHCFQNIFSIEWVYRFDSNTVTHRTLPGLWIKSNMALTSPSSEETLKLFQDIESKFPSSTLGKDKWEVLAVENIHFETIANANNLRFLQSQAAATHNSPRTCTSTSYRSPNIALLNNVKHSSEGCGRH